MSIDDATEIWAGADSLSVSLVPDARDLGAAHPGPAPAERGVAHIVEGMINSKNSRLPELNECGARKRQHGIVVKTREQCHRGARGIFQVR